MGQNGRWPHVVNVFIQTGLGGCLTRIPGTYRDRYFLRAGVPDLCNEICLPR